MFKYANDIRIFATLYERCYDILLRSTLVRIEEKLSYKKSNTDRTHGPMSRGSSKSALMDGYNSRSRHRDARSDAPTSPREVSFVTVGNDELPLGVKCKVRHDFRQSMIPNEQSSLPRTVSKRSLSDGESLPDSIWKSLPSWTLTVTSFAPSIGFRLARIDREVCLDENRRAMKATRSCDCSLGRLARIETRRFERPSCSMFPLPGKKWSMVGPKVTESRDALGIVLNPYRALTSLTRDNNFGPNIN